MSKEYQQLSKSTPANKWPKELYSNKEFALIAVSLNGQAFSYLSENLRNDYDVALKSVEHFGRTIEHTIHKNDLALATIAVNKSSKAFIYLSPVLQDNEQLAYTAISQNGNLLQFASDRLKSDRDFIFSLIKKSGICLQHSEFKDDRQLALLSLKSFGVGLKHLNEEFQNDKEMVLRAVEHDGLALEFASKKLQNDSDIVALAISENGLALKFASLELKNDLHLVKKAIQKDARALQHTPLNDNYELVLSCIKHSGTALKYASDSLKSNFDLVSIAIKQQAGAISFAHKTLQENPILLLKIIKKNKQNIRYVPVDIRRDIGQQDPITYFETIIFYNQLDSTVSNKLETKTKKIKI